MYFVLVKPDATLLMENHFSKIPLKPIAITPSNQQDKWDDSSSLLYFMNIPQVVLFYFFFSVTEPKESTLKADKLCVHDVEIKSTLID